MEHFPTTTSKTDVSPADCDRKSGPFKRMPTSPIRIECRTCAFEPEDQLELPRTPCPKCRSNAWRRSFPPGALLLGAQEPRPRKIPKKRVETVAVRPPAAPVKTILLPFICHNRTAQLRTTALAALRSAR